METNILNGSKMTLLFLSILFVVINFVCEGQAAGFPASGNITWTFTKIGSHPATVSYGQKLQYEVTMHWPATTSDVLIELYTASDNDTAQFVICSPQISSVGSNFNINNKTEANEWWILEAKGNDYRYERAILNLRSLNNSGADSSADEPNQIKFTFNAVIINTPSMINGTNYYVSFGARYHNKEKVWVGQASYMWVNETISSWGNNTYELTGPSSLREGEIGIYVVKLVLRNMLNQIIMDIFAPLNTTDIMSICHAAIPDDGVGESYSCQAKDGKLTYPGNVSYNTETGEYRNSIATLDLGEVINAKKRSGSTSEADDTLYIRIAAKMLNGSNMGDVHKFGVALQYNHATIWASSVNVSLDNSSWTAPTESPVFKIESPMEVLPVNSYVPIFINMTIPKSSASTYKLEVALPFNDSLAIMTFVRLRVLHVGKNIPCFYYSNSTIVPLSSANDSNKDYIIFDMGVIANMGIRSGLYDDDITIEVVAQVLNHSLIGTGEEIKVIAGIRYGNAIWVDAKNFTITSDPSSSTQTPDISLKSAHTNNMIYNGSGHAFWLEIFVPPLTRYHPMDIELLTVTDNNRALLSLCDIKILEVGEHIIGINSSTINIQEISTADDKYKDRALINFTNTVTNVGRFNYEWEKLRNILRLQIVVHVVPHSLINTSSLLNDSLYWIGASVKYSSSKLWVGRANLTYDPTTVFNNITTTENATFTKENITESTNMYVGGAYAYKIKMTSYPQAYGHYIFDAVALNSSLHVCRVGLKKRGINVPCLSPMTEEQRTLINTSATQTAGVKLDLYNFVNTGLTTYHNSNENNTGEFDVVVQLRSGFGDISAGNTQMVASVVYMGDTKLWVNGANLNPIDGTPNVTFTPTITLGLRNGSSTIVHGGAVVAQLEMWLPAGSLGKYTIDFIVPWNTTDRAKLHICSVRVISAGWNIPCLNDTTLERIYNDTYNTQTNDRCQIQLDYVPNIATSGATKQEDNKVLVEATIQNVAENSTVGETLWIAAMVNISDTTVWVGSKNVTITGDSPSATELNPYFKVIPPNEGEVTMEIFEEKTFTINMTFPESITKLVLTVFSNTSEGEGHFGFQDLNATFYGANYVCNEKHNMTYTNESTYGTSQKDKIVAQVVLTNTGTFRRYQWADYHKDSDVLQFEVKARLTDHPANLNGTKQTIYFQIQYSDQVKTESTQVTVVAQNTNKPNLQIFLDVQNKTLEENVPGSEIEFTLRINHTNTSRANAYNTNIYWYIPHVLKYNSLVSWEGMDPNITDNGNEGLVLSIDKLMYTDNITVNINLTIDPTNKIPMGSLVNYVTVPVDAYYLYREKENGVFIANTSDYTITYRTGFEVFVDDCWGALGMESGAIKDCQIRASGYNGTDTPLMGRLNSTAAWTTPHRGSGFFEQEYLEVSMGNKTRLTAVTLQPSATDVTAMVTNFSLQYSDEGLLWFNVKDNSTNSTKIFECSYSAGVAYVKLNTNVYGRYFRLIPRGGGPSSYSRSLRVEFHGCAIKTDTDIANACFGTEVISPDYKTRGLLLIEADGGILYVCMSRKPGERAYCSSSNDFGDSWKEVDGTVSYITFYNPTINTLFGINGDKSSKVKSPDHGWSWFSTSEEEYAANKASAQKIEAKEIPFLNTAGQSASDMHSLYGFSLNTTHKVSITMDGVMFSTDSGSTYNTKSYWGTSRWE